MYRLKRHNDVDPLPPCLKPMETNPERESSPKGFKTRGKRELLWGATTFAFAKGGFPSFAFGSRVECPPPFFAESVFRYPEKIVLKGSSSLREITRMESLSLPSIRGKILKFFNYFSMLCYF